jgi:hypothetical protein
MFIKRLLEKEGTGHKTAGGGSDGKNALRFTMRASGANCNLAAHQFMQVFALFGEYLVSICKAACKMPDAGQTFAV